MNKIKIFIIYLDLFEKNIIFYFKRIRGERDIKDENSNRRCIMLLGQSPEILTARRIIREAGKSDVNVLIIGEVGTGRKHTALEIRHRSTRVRKPFVVLNCPAVGDTITDDEIFGKRVEGPKGFERKLGIIEKANRGILFLENVEDLDPEYQKRFFNIFKEGKFKRPSEDEYVKIDIRLIASATDEKKLKKETFRQDFLALLSQLKIYLPPLRNRRQDIPILFNHFMNEHFKDSQEEMPAVPTLLFESIMEYEWPGNVTELKNAIENLILLSPEDKLSIEYLPFEVRRHPFEFLDGMDLPSSVGEVEKYMIRKSLRRYAGNQTKSARALKISEAALRYKMKKYGFSKKEF